MKVKEVIKIIERDYPTFLAEEWDNVGLIIGNDNTEVKKIQLSLDATERVIDYAIENKVDMLITHHPVIFKNIKKINNSTVMGKKIIKALENRLSIYSIHTNLDSASGGLNDFILKMLGIERAEIIDINPKDDMSGIGRVYTLDNEILIEEYIWYLKDKLKIKNVRAIIRDVKKKVQKIALINGAGIKYWKKVQKMGVDLFITADVGYHEALEIKETGLDLLDIGHFESEKVFTELMLGKLKEKGIEIIIFNDGPIFKNY